MKSSIFWNITPCSPLKVNRFSEEHIASIFRVEEQAEQETSVKAGGKKSLCYTWMTHTYIDTYNPIFETLEELTPLDSSTHTSFTLYKTEPAPQNTHKSYTRHTERNTRHQKGSTNVFHTWNTNTVYYYMLQTHHIMRRLDEIML
jgi:hypothetical protein